MTFSCVNNRMKKANYVLHYLIIRGKIENEKSVLLFLVGFTILTGCGKAVDGSKQSQSAAVDPEIPQIESEVSVSASEDNARVTERSPEEIQRELESVPDMITEPTVISGLNIDDIIEFGSYEQDYNKENGAEPIEWYVIDIDDKSAKLMSVYALDCENIMTSMKV